MWGEKKYITSNWSNLNAPSYINNKKIILVIID